MSDRPTSEGPSEEIQNDAQGEESFAASVESIIGRAPTDEELEESLGYDELRRALRHARIDADESQAELARRLKVGQSEVSRLETSVGPTTQFGRIRNYLKACGAQFKVVVQTATGQEHSAWSGASDDQGAVAVPAWAKPLLGQRLGPGVGLTTCVLAIDDTLQLERGFSPRQSMKFRNDACSPDGCTITR